jgi:hypothetical protein
VSSTRPQAAILLLAAVTGCGAEDEVMLTVAGDAPGAVVLFARLVDDQGAPPRVYSAGDADRPVKLPATVYLRVAHSKRVGLVVWLADAGGSIVAEARTDQCAELAGSGKYTITLASAPDGWTPALADACRCDPADPLGPMCPAKRPGDAGSPVGDAGQVDAALALDAASDVPPDASAPEPDSAPDAAADAALDGLPAGRDAAAGTRDDAAGTRDAADDRAPDLGAADLPPASVPSALFGFEMTAPDWTSADTPLVHDTSVRTEGAASVAFTTAGTTTLRSRSFDTRRLNLSGTRISVDLFVDEKQSGDANTEMWVDCQSAGVFGVYMGYKALGALKAPAWTSLTYRMPAEVLDAFAGDFTDCQVWFQLVGKGLFRYDRMGFAP